MALLLTTDYLQDHGIQYRDREYPKGTQLITEKEQYENKFYIVLEGELDVFVDSGNQTFDIPLNVLREGDYFGELALLDMGARSASVKVKTLAAKLRVISEKEFKHLIDAQPQEVLREFIKKLVEQVRRLTARVRVLGLKTVTERLQAALQSFGVPVEQLLPTVKAKWLADVSDYQQKMADQTVSASQQAVIQDCVSALQGELAEYQWLAVELPHSREQLSRYIRSDRAPVSREIKALEKTDILLDLAPKRILVKAEVSALEV